MNNNWIPVREENLPEIGEDVLVLLDGETILKGRLKHNGWTAYFLDGEQLCFPRVATHWMPLPALPGEKQLHNKAQRTQIAAICLQGLLAHGSFDMIAEEELVKDACNLADALLTHLENTSK